MEQQNPDRFSPHPGDQFPLDRLLGDQSHGPACLTFWRIAAHHGDDALLLIGVQDLCGARPLLFIEGAVQAGLLIAMAQPPNRLRGQLHHSGDLGRTGMLRQLQERQRPKDDADLLHSALHQLPQFLLILLCDIDLQSWATHTSSMRQNNSTYKCFLESFQAVEDLERKGLQLRNAGQLKEAAELFAAIVKEQPDWEQGTGFYNLACCYEDLGELALAEKCFRAALQYEPRNSYFLGGLASFLYLHGDIDKAFASYLTLLEVERESGDQRGIATAMTGLQSLGKKWESRRKFSRHKSGPKRRLGMKVERNPKPAAHFELRCAGQSVSGLRHDLGKPGPGTGDAHLRSERA